MAAAGLIATHATAPFGRVLWLRAALIASVIAIWELVSASGYFYEGVMPSAVRVVVAFARLTVSGEFYWNLAITLYEIGVALAIGLSAGVAAGLALGASRFVGRAFEPYLYYLGPTPKIIFLPIMIVWFGVGPGSKIAMGAISCFFPMALSAAAGMRQIDKVLIRVGRSFKARPWHMVQKIYLPSMVLPLINGARLGLGVCIIGVLLAETRLSNRGLGFMAIQDYRLFQIADLYALLIMVFLLAVLANELVGWLGRVLVPDRRAKDR
jgi:NitT/TauT family transport system permease protein